MSPQPKGWKAASCSPPPPALNPLAGSLSNPYSNAPAGTQIDGSAPVADTIEAKLQHIQNYPFFIGQLNRDGAVPQPAVGNIQNDLRSLIGTMHPGDSATTLAFNTDLRNAQNTYNILPSQAQALNRDFGAVLLAAGADPQVTADLQAQMNSLAQRPRSSPTPRSSPGTSTRRRWNWPSGPGARFWRRPSRVSRRPAGRGPSTSSTSPSSPSRA